MNKLPEHMQQQMDKAKVGVNSAIIEMRRVDINNASYINYEEAVPVFITYLRAKIVEVESWPGCYYEDVELLESMIAEIEAINPQLWINGKPA